MDKIYDITPHQDINDILKLLSKGLKCILDNQLIGIYLTGSLTYGDFDRGSSDIDILVVMPSPLSDDQRDQVKNLHDRIAKKYLKWAKRVECSYITDDMLHNDNPPIQPRPYINGGVMWDPDPPYGNEWLLNLYVLYDCGITLVGQDIKALIGHRINIETVREASKKDFHQEWEPLLRDSSRLTDSHFQAYVIFTLCRILHRAKNDHVVSKKIASTWVKNTYGMPWIALIKKVENWQHGQDLDALNETVNFITFTLLELEHQNLDEFEQSKSNNQLITSCLKTYYGIDVTTLKFLPIGADMNASVYKAQTHDETSYFVKLKRNYDHDISVEIVELLHDAGIQQLIPPIKTIHGQLAQHTEAFAMIVYPFVEGQDGFHRDLKDNQWITLGKALSQVHEIVVPPSIEMKVRREYYSPKWREIVRSLYSHIETEPSGDEISLKLLKFMKEHLVVIRRLVDRADKLGQKLRDQSPKFVLCHSDIHGGNVMIDEKDAIYIVDWDDPIMAPKERDLMFIGGGVANVWNRPHEEKLFYQGYGETEINRSVLAYYRHERIVEDIAEYGQALLLSKAGGEDRAEMYKQFVGMFEPHGVVDIAFKTDE